MGLTSCSLCKEIPIFYTKKTSFVKKCKFSLHIIVYLIRLSKYLIEGQCGSALAATFGGMASKVLQAMSNQVTRKVEPDYKPSHTTEPTAGSSPKANPYWLYCILGRADHSEFYLLAAGILL